MASFGSCFDVRRHGVSMTSPMPALMGEFEVSCHWALSPYVGYYERRWSHSCMNTEFTLSDCSTWKFLYGFSDCFTLMWRVWAVDHVRIYYTVVCCYSQSLPLVNLFLADRCNATYVRLLSSCLVCLSSVCDTRVLLQSSWSRDNGIAWFYWKV